MSNSRLPYIVDWLPRCLAVCVVVVPSCAWAHPVSLSSAVVVVNEHQLTIEMQVMLEDLVLYHELVADGEMNYSASDLTLAADKHREFILEYFTVLDGNGKRLLGRVERLDNSQVGTDQVPQRELMQRCIGMDIVYQLEQERPEFLTFLQNFGGDQSSLPAIMDLHIVRDEHFQESAQIAARRPHTVRIDWARENDGRRETIAELRKRRKEQFQSRLGISSYSGLYSFLYITRFAIRHEILIPLLTLEQWVPIQRAVPDFLEVAEQSAASEPIKQYFENQGKVTVNGQTVPAKIERINFFGLDINDFALNAEPRRVSVPQARVGVIISFPCTSEPHSTTVSWDAFSEAAPFIDSVVLVGNEKPDRFYFHPKATQFVWNGNFSVPEVEPILASRSLSEPQESRAIVAGLLSNIYRAFEFRDDSEVYDALASSIQGDLLREVYLRFKKSLLVAEHGGEMSRAQQVEVTDVRSDSSNLMSIQATWRVSSATEHWGHIHQRLSEYRAKMVLVSDNSFWKFQQFQLLDEKRLQFETSIRGYDSNR